MRTRVLTMNPSLLIESKSLGQVFLEKEAHGGFHNKQGPRFVDLIRP